MSLCTAFLYTQLSGFIVPQSKIPAIDSLPLISISARSSSSSSSNPFAAQVLAQTVVSAESKLAEYTVPEDNIPYANGMGIALGMLKAMKIKPKDFGQSRLSGLAYTLVMDKAIRRRSRRIRIGDNFKIVIDEEGRISLNLNKSTARRRAAAFSQRMSRSPAYNKRAGYKKAVHKKRTAFNIEKMPSYVQQVANKSKVDERAHQVEYIVHDDDIPNASAMGTALGMLHALKVESSDFGQSRLQGLALRLVLRRAIRRRARSLHKGDRFLIRVANKGKISLDIYSGTRALPVKSFQPKRSHRVISQRIPEIIVPQNQESFAQEETMEDDIETPGLNKKSADQQLAAFSQEGVLAQEDDPSLDEAFKPENIIQNNINAIIAETITGLKVPPPIAKDLRKDLEAFIRAWSEKAIVVDKTFLNGFVGVIVQKLVKITGDKAKDQASQKKTTSALLAGFKEEHDFYDTKEEALLDTAKQILKTTQELASAKKK